MKWIEPDWPAPANVRALSTTRDGGVSEGVFAGLNLGAHVGDEPVRVEANRARLQQAAQIPGPSTGSIRCTAPWFIRSAAIISRRRMPTRPAPMRRSWPAS